LQVADTENLKRGLFLTTQLAEMGMPVVLSLNMEDEARSRGLRTDSTKLRESLGIDVINTVATQRQGIGALKETLHAPRVPRRRISYPEAIEEGIEKIETLLPESFLSRRSLALMLLAGDRTLEEWLVAHSSPENRTQIRAIGEQVQRKSAEPLSYLINKIRMEAAESLRAAGTLVDVLENSLFGGILNPLATQLVDKTVSLALLRDLIVGNYGLITVGLTDAMAIVLPIVGTFFLTFALKAFTCSPTQKTESPSAS